MHLGSVLSRIIEYCEFHADIETNDEEGKSKRSDEEIKCFDNDYTKVVQSTLYDLILARSLKSAGEILDE